MTPPKFPWGTFVEATIVAFKNGVFAYDQGKVYGVVVGCDDKFVWVVRHNRITSTKYALLFWKTSKESWD